LIFEIKSNYNINCHGYSCPTSCVSLWRVHTDWKLFTSRKCYSIDANIFWLSAFGCRRWI